jgi:mRNA-degrading endonuclease toxin of MazEF toxin-antitoxin module
MAFKRYNIHWVNLDPARGSELRKTRPEGRTTGPLTTLRAGGLYEPEADYRILVLLSCGPVVPILAVSKSRLGKKLGSLSARDAAALRRLLGEMYGEE